MTTNAPRAPIDFDAFERELQPSADVPPRATGYAPTPEAGKFEAGKSDPLAELARIVGQDDPFRALLEARGTARGAGRTEPVFEDAAETARDDAAHESDDTIAFHQDTVMREAAAHEGGMAGAAVAGSAGAFAPSPADAFDRYLASVQQSHDANDLPDAAFVPENGAHRAGQSRPRPRGRLMQVGAGLGVLAVCVGGALAWRGVSGSPEGSGPVTVLADKSPLKVAPEKADGVDIPDQNKQIYDRNAKDGQIKVVNREEQPLDVAQAARAASRDAAPQGGVTPGAPGLLTESLGEPRRIRTVAVKPDTPPPAMPAREPQAETTTPEARAEAKPERAERHAAISPIPTMTLPDPEATATPAAAPRPTRSAAKPAAPASPAAAPGQDLANADEDAPAKPAPRRGPTRRVATATPEATIAALEAEPAAPVTTTASTSPAPSTGGFAVQLGVRNSETDARAALQQMQAKHAQLAGKPELIRQAEVNGKSFYRVRVGPLGKAEAASLCSALKGAGTACFVAAN